MFTINKAMIVTAAALAVGLVVAVDIAQSRPERSAAATVGARFPAAHEMLATFDRPEQARPVRHQEQQGVSPSGDCAREHWPYIADECLTAPGEGDGKRPARTIAIERRIAQAAH